MHQLTRLKLCLNDTKNILGEVDHLIWPRQSLDLNIIKNLWGILEKKQNK